MLTHIFILDVDTLSHTAWSYKDYGESGYYFVCTSAEKGDRDILFITFKEGYILSDSFEILCGTKIQTQI